MQLFKPVLSSLSGAAFPYLFIHRPLILNEAEVSEDGWRSSDGIGPRVGWYIGDCAPPWKGNREKVVLCCISKCSPCKPEMSHKELCDKPILIPEEVMQLYLAPLCGDLSKMPKLYFYCIEYLMKSLMLCGQYVTEKLQIQPWTSQRGPKSHFHFSVDSLLRLGLVPWHTSLYSMGAWLTEND